MTFYNDKTNHSISVSAPALWAFLFGFFYFILHGIWTHATIYVCVVLFTGGIAAPFLWVGYAVGAKSILINHYASRGYAVVSQRPMIDGADASVE
jgi:apolipoprotein N-acyltransferase